jgi:hypothetical protein
MVNPVDGKSTLCWYIVQRCVWFGLVRSGSVLSLSANRRLFCGLKNFHRIAGRLNSQRQAAHNHRQFPAEVKDRGQNADIIWTDSPMSIFYEDSYRSISGVRLWWLRVGLWQEPGNERREPLEGFAVCVAHGDGHWLGDYNLTRDERGWMTTEWV